MLEPVITVNNSKLEVVESTINIQIITIIIMTKIIGGIIKIMIKIIIKISIILKLKI